MASKLHAHTPSDAGPWANYRTSESTDEHVVPGFEGRRHLLVWDCWCHPFIECFEDGELVHHNVAQ